MTLQDLDKLSDDEFALYAQQRKQKLEAKKKKQREAYEALKMDTIIGLSLKAKQLNKYLTDFKTEAFDSLQALYKCLQEYSQRHADGKGSFTMESECFKIIYKRQGKPTFDEKSNQAEKHIIDFLESRYSGDKDTKDLILSLLERKNGDLDINLVQKLYQMETRFDDQNWRRGIELLKESYQYCFSKDYIKFAEKNENGEWIPIVLQFSKV
jgi:hypothetical protein